MAQVSIMPPVDSWTCFNTKPAAWTVSGEMLDPPMRSHNLVPLQWTYLIWKVVFQLLQIQTTLHPLYLQLDPPTNYLGNGIYPGLKVSLKKSLHSKCAESANYSHQRVRGWPVSGQPWMKLEKWVPWQAEAQLLQAFADHGQEGTHWKVPEALLQLRSATKQLILGLARTLPLYAKRNL